MMGYVKPLAFNLEDLNHVVGLYLNRASSVCPLYHGLFVMHGFVVVGE